MLHALITLLIGAGLFPLNLHREGMLMVALFYLGREHTQAEYRWIAQFVAGKRANMPWWGGFSWRAWNLPSLLDWFVPVLACAVVYFVSTL